MNSNIMPLSELHALGWSLMHFVWQGALIALIYQGIVKIGCFKSASIRYAIGCLAMFAMCAVPIITFWHYQTKGEVSDLVTKTAFSEPMSTSIAAPSAVRVTEASGIEQVATRQTSQDSSQNPFNINQYLDPALPWIVGCWGFGVLLLAIRLLLGWLRLRAMQRRQVSSVSGEWQKTFEALARRMSIQRPVRLVRSLLTETPAVIGYLRPIILFPTTALIGLSPSQIELLLAHELAHVRRHDYIVNLMQSLVEVLLFYHPAVWWLSRQVREDREHCCDDIAVKICGNKLEYVRTLVAMEELRGLAPALSVGAKTGSLLQRVRRLLEPQSPSRGQSAWWVVGAILLILGMAGLNRPFAAAQKSDDKVQNPKISVGVNLPPAAAEKPGDSQLNSEKSKSPWFRPLKNGLSVELVGVSVDTEDKNRSWWTPDGRNTIEAPYDESKGSHSFGNPRVPRQFVFKVLGPEAHVDAEVIPSASLTTAAQSAMKNGKELNDLFLIFADFPLNKKTCDIRLNIASGDWKIRSFPGKGGSAISGSDYGMLVSDSLEVDGKTRVTVTYKKSESQQIRLRVKDINEKVHSPIQTLVSHGIGDIQQESLVYPLPLNQVHQYQIETRERQTAEFKRVVLNPANLLIMSPVLPRLQFRLVAEENQQNEAEEYANSGNSGATLHILKEILLSEKHIRSAKVQRNYANQNPEVAFTLTDEGKAIFHQITQSNIQRQLAIIFDNRLLSAPRIMSPIPGGKGVISGNFSEEEAKALADCLNKAK